MMEHLSDNEFVLVSIPNGEPAFLARLVSFGSGGRAFLIYLSLDPGCEGLVRACVGGTYLLREVPTDSLSDERLIELSLKRAIRQYPGIFFDRLLGMVKDVTRSRKLRLAAAKFCEVTPLREVLPKSNDPLKEEIGEIIEAKREAKRKALKE